MRITPSVLRPFTTTTAGCCGRRCRTHAVSRAVAKPQSPRGPNPDLLELIQTLLAAGSDLAATEQKGDTPIKAVERKRAAEKLPYYQGCYDAQAAELRAAATTR